MTKRDAKKPTANTAYAAETPVMIDDMVSVFSPDLEVAPTEKFQREYIEPIEQVVYTKPAPALPTMTGHMLAQQRALAILLRCAEGNTPIGLDDLGDQDSSRRERFIDDAAIAYAVRGRPLTTAWRDAAILWDSRPKRV